MGASYRAYIYKVTGVTGIGNLAEERRFVMLEQSSLTAEVLERKDTPNTWGVEAIHADGGIDLAIFSGPDARARAIEYARAKYVVPVSA